MRHSPGHAARGDGGFTLIEAMVAAIVFAAVATLSAQLLVHANDATSRSYTRTTAVGILNTQTERVRGQDVSDIPAGPVRTSQTVKGVVYTATTTSTYADVSAADGDVCTSTATSLRHKRVVVTVAYPDGGKVTTVRSETLRTTATSTPAGSTGALAVRLTDAAGTATLSGTVTLSDGASTQTSVTDGVGCAVFTGLAAGNYAAWSSVSGQVADNGTDVATTGVLAVTGGTVTRRALRFVPGRTLLVALDPATGVVPSGLSFLLSGNYLPANLVPVCVATPSTPCMTGSPGPIQHLFADNYSVQAGVCGSTTGLSAASADLRTATSGSVTVPMSTVQLSVRTAAGTPVGDGRTVTFTRTSAALCPTGSETLTSRVTAGSTEFTLPYGSWTVAVPSLSATSTTRVSVTAATSPGTRSVAVTAVVVA